MYVVRCGVLHGPLFRHIRHQSNMPKLTRGFRLEVRAGSVFYYVKKGISDLKRVGYEVYRLGYHSDAYKVVKRATRGLFYWSFSTNISLSATFKHVNGHMLNGDEYLVASIATDQFPVATMPCERSDKNGEEGRDTKG